MKHNVGSKERYARIAAALAAGVGAMNTSGWQRATLGTLAAAGLATGVSGYCPINDAVGRETDDEGSRLEQGRRDAELRRQMALANALGTPPSASAPMPRVSASNDVLGRE